MPLYRNVRLCGRNAIIYFLEDKKNTVWSDGVFSFFLGEIRIL